jgi:xylulokinase
MVSSEFLEYPTIRAKPGWAVHRPEDWWEAVTRTLRLLTGSIDPKDILGIGTAGTQEGILPVDNAGKKLYDCMTWNDTRSVPEQMWIRTHIDENELLSTSGTTWSFPGSAPRVLYIKKHLPEIYERTHRFLSAKDYVNYRLTQEFATDWTTASHTQLLDIRAREWSSELMDRMGISVEKWPRVVAPTEVIGRVTEQAAKETGLTKGTPVVAGAGDNEAAAIGSGNTTLFEVAGTTDLLCANLEKPIVNRQTPCFCHPDRNKWVIMMWPGLIGGILRWFKDTLGRTEAEVAGKLGMTPYQIMDFEAEEVESRPSNMLFLPNIGKDEEMREGSVIFNLNLNHRRGDIIKAMFEGSAFSLRYSLELLRKFSGIDGTDIILSGGVAKSRIWRQIRADVTSKTLILPSVLEATALGTALLAGVGARVYNDIANAEGIVNYKEKTFPRQELVSKYNKSYNEYKELREMLANFSHEKGEDIVS